MKRLDTLSNHSGEEQVRSEADRSGAQGERGSLQSPGREVRTPGGGYCHRHAGNGADAEDVGQETFIRFWGALDRFRGESAVGTYLTRIAINLSLNALERRKRARGRFRSLDEEEAGATPAADGRDEEEKRERGEWVRAAVAELKPEHRAVVVLRMIDGYSTKETASLLNLPEGTVLSRLYRGMEKLKGLLGSALEDYGQ